MADIPHMSVQFDSCPVPDWQHDCHMGADGRQAFIPRTQNVPGQPIFVGRCHGLLLDPIHLHRLHSWSMGILAGILSSRAVHATDIGLRLGLHPHRNWNRPVSH